MRTLYLDCGMGAARGYADGFIIAVVFRTCKTGEKVE